MNEVQERIFEILTEVGRILEENDIDYYLSYGTAIGAIRHKGFIPWDDDADLSIMKKDVDRFTDAMEKELDKGRFFLQYPNTADYQLDLFKVRMNDTTYVETLYKDSSMHQGVFVDVFVLEDHPDGIRRRMYSSLVYSYTMTTYMYYKTKSRITKMLIRSYRKFMKRFLDAFFIDTDSELTSIRAYDFTTSVFPRRYFGRPRPIEFEGRKFYVPEKVEEYLTEGYGDYMTIPEESERKYHELYMVEMNRDYKESLKSEEFLRRKNI